MIVRFAHRLYKLFLSPWFGNTCRFYPSCSDYALEAVETHGVVRGSFYSLLRLLRCQPLCRGGVDLVPPR